MIILVALAVADLNHSCPPLIVFVGLATSRLEAEMLAKELQHVILKTISNLARVSSLVLVKGVRDSILNKHVMQFGCVAS
jgi:tartrate dehydratase alpha subunit/fumarate hydratase class I-like protein